MSHQFSIQMPPRVNGRNPRRGLSIVRRATAESPTRDPEDIARRIQRISDAEIARVRRRTRRWSLRRLVEYVRHDEILSGIFGGFTGWFVAGWLALAGYTLLVLVGVL